MKNDLILNTKSYRMLLIINKLQKKDALKIIEIFAKGGLEISKSRAMNLISSYDDMSTLELHCFICGLFQFYKN